MKKLLLGTTALVAMGAFPALVEAADKLELGISGYYRFYGQLGDIDDGTDAASPTGAEIGAATREHGFSRESEVHFRGQTTLDNGIKVGVRIELEGETSLDQIDNSWIYFDGGFGRVEMGSMWGPGVIMFYGAPGHVMPGRGNFSSFADAPTPFYGYFSSYNFRLDGVNDKIVYYSPRFAGFQIGLSYTPDNKAAVGGIEESGAGLNPDANGGQSEIITVGANYVNTFGGFDVALYGSYSEADAEVVGVNDSDSWNLGAQVGYMGFKVGGSYLHVGDLLTTGTTGRDHTEWELGASYATGPWTFGIAYMNLEQDGGLSPANGLFTSDDEGQYYSLAATYAIGPGILLVGGVTRHAYDSGTDVLGAKSAADGDTTQLILGTSISF